MTHVLLATQELDVSYEVEGAGIVLVFLLVWLAVFGLLVASMWRVFTKAGEPGWAAIVPIYNVVVLLNVARRPGWWVLLSFIPLVNVVILIIVAMDVAKNFGKGSGFGVGLIFLPFIFYPILAFSDDRFQPQD